MKFRILIVGLIVLALAVNYSCSPSTKEEQKKPNIVFILADDLGWADLPVYGNQFNEAPNLQKMASEGTTYQNAYAACPVCSPTRASLQSGQYPARVGVIDFIPGHFRPYEKVIVPRNKTQYLPNEAFTIGEAMKQAGYVTGYFGKWHLGYDPETHPSAQGYDTAIVFRGGPFFNVGPKMDPVQDVDPQKVLAEVLTDWGVDFIEANKEKPFFLFLAHYDVHVQLDADSTMIHYFKQKEKVDDYPCNAVYAAMIKNLDNSVGRIMAKLDELGLSENTLFVFFSDNGGLITRYYKIPLIARPKQYVYEGDTLLYVASSNKPLRSEKGTVFEGGIREPMIVRWPGKVAAGASSNAIISSVDMLPTFAELAGTQIPDSVVIDGRSLVTVFQKDEYDPDRAVFWHYPVYHHDVPASAVRKGDWKLIEYLDDETFELYNLKDDIGETTDVCSQYPERCEELKMILLEWKQDVGAQGVLPNPDFDPARREEWGRHPDWEKLFGNRKQVAKDVIPGK